MLYDFHTHTFLSDGELSPMELIRRAAGNGYAAIGITDHAGPGQLKRFITETVKDCKLAEEYWQIKALVGVELTHLPPSAIPDAARHAKEIGASLVIVHGETIVEPVEPGTNKAAVRSPDVDILAHPGLLSTEEATLAAENGVFIELSARKGHSLTNGHIARTTIAANAMLLLGSDAHSEEDLLTRVRAEFILKGAGLESDEIRQTLDDNPKVLLSKLGIG
ncbi:MAG: histidinol phosphate phosphatase domain-containing protein [Dehalococcoidia bacterium]